MADLVQWLNAQLDADAAPIPMPAWHEPYCLDPYVQDGVCGYCGGEEDPAKVTYQERPPGVLRDIETKRRIVDAHERRPMPKGDTADCAQCWGAVWPCPTLRLLASVYDDREGYRSEWAPSE